MPASTGTGASGGPDACVSFSPLPTRLHLVFLAPQVQGSSGWSCRGVPARAGPAPPDKGQVDVAWTLGGITR